MRQNPRVLLTCDESTRDCKTQMVCAAYLTLYNNSYCVH